MNDNRIPVRAVKCNKSLAGVSKGKLIYLRKEGSVGQGGEFFRITDSDENIAKGGSCICYNAILVNEKKQGRLKEFYPLDESFELVRREGDNHIVSAESTAEAFRNARDSFVNSYHLLRDVMAKRKRSAELTSFIPDFSIYYACDEEGNLVDNSTAYVFTPAQNLTVFDKYIEDIHKNPTVNPEHKLFTVLKTVETLVKCLKILHEKSLLHLDIKPSNFGIPKRKRELLSDTITLFDFNTIYSASDESCGRYESEGFSAPEIRRGRADNRSDIYSVGCTLFAALAVNDEMAPGEGYKDNLYTRIPELIEHSRLICASETNSNVYLKQVLIHILRRCLHSAPQSRYQSCDELVKDLEEAISFLYPSEMKAKLKPNQELIVMERELDKKRGVGTHVSLLYHLYKHPLYERVSADSDSINVLIVGFGNYGQKFLDSCLQVGQIGKKLNVDVISHNKLYGNADKDIYLSTRPELPSFFSINGESVSDSYGSIRFFNKDFAVGAGSIKKNADIALDILTMNSDVGYIFIALGDNKLNKSVARAFTTVMSELELECSVNFAVEGAMRGKAFGNPVMMSKDVTREDEYKEIERMALNTHLLWEDGLNVDLPRVISDFKKPYNYNSSLASAISVKYKLRHVSLTMDDLSSAAREYKRIIESDKEKRNELIAAEHRRWNCEKICDGYRPIPTEECIEKGYTKDTRRKLHCCLVRSEANAPLESWSYAKWEKGDTAELDELDRLSIDLHRGYKRRADELRELTPLFDETVQRLKSLAAKSAQTAIAFSEWFSTLSLLWSEVASTRLYNSLKSNLIAKLEQHLDADDRLTAISLVKMIDERFSIIVKSREYTDWKAKDARLVDGVPFLLTHKKNNHLAIPLSVGNNSRTFANVAAPTVVNPTEITYIHHLERSADIPALRDAVKYVFNYLPEKNITTRLNWVITYKAEVEGEIEGLRELLESNGLTRRAVLVESSDSDIAGKVTCEIEKLHVDCLEQNSSPLSYLLLGAGAYAGVSSYRFDPEEKRFYDVEGCEWLNYISGEQYLTVSDIFGAKNSKGIIDSPLAFQNDYLELWKLYRGNEMSWKNMCTILAEYHKGADQVITVNSSALKTKGNIEKYRYLLPTHCFKGVSKVLKFLVESGVFESDTSVHHYTPDSIEITVSASDSLRDKVEKLFENVDYFAYDEQLICTSTAYSVAVEYDSLRVSSVDLSRYATAFGFSRNSLERIKNILKTLAEKFSFIFGLTESANDEFTVSFNYSTRRMKSLITKEGQLAEIYIYLKCLNSGYFSDVAASYEVAWDDSPVKNEFDMIVTHGFKSLLVEIKARSDIKADFYYKLSTLANQFGTNSKAVLIADTIENGFNVGKAEANEVQRTRGDMLDVYTVFNSKDIDNIDVVLADLLGIRTKKTVEKKKNEISRESKIWVLNSPLQLLPQNLVSILDNNYRLKTLGAFLELSEEQIAEIRNTRGETFKNEYLGAYRRLKEMLS